MFLFFTFKHVFLFFSKLQLLCQCSKLLMSSLGSIINVDCITPYVYVFTYSLVDEHNTIHACSML